MCRRAPRDAAELDEQHRPNVDFDTKGRAYQVTLPFNAFWDETKLHPNGAHRRLVQRRPRPTLGEGQRRRDLEQSPNASAKQVGHVEDKQWIAVNRIPRQPVPGPRLRGVVGLQRLHEQDPVSPSRVTAARRSARP